MKFGKVLGLDMDMKMNLGFMVLSLLCSGGIFCIGGVFEEWKLDLV